MRKLFEAKESIPTGLHPSVPDDQVPFWIEGLNVIFQEKSVQPAPGHNTLFKKPDSKKIMGVLELLVDGERNLFFGSRTKLYRWVEGDIAATDVTNAGGDYTATDDSFWSLESWGDQVLATNNVDKAQIWSKAAPAAFVNLDGYAGSDWVSTWRHKIFKKNGPFVLAFNFSDGDQIFRFNDEDNVGIWTPRNDNFAGDDVVRDLNSPILCVHNLGVGLGIYGFDRLHIVRYVGAPFVFSQKHVTNGIGALGPQSVVQVGRLNFGMGPRGFFVTDGVTYNYIDSPSIHDHVYDNLDKSNQHKAVGWDDPLYEITYFSYPTQGSTENDTTVAFNRQNKTWSIMPFARTAAVSSSVFDTPITVDKNGNVYSQGVSGSTGSDAIPLRLSAEASYKAGYGSGGYGQGGYGGKWSTSG